MKRGTAAERLAIIRGILERGRPRAAHVNDHNSPIVPRTYWWHMIQPYEMRRIYRLTAPVRKARRKR